uniref:Uncharacterized protein n=1 Tax=Anas platyrhynchos platyrhynchos TaxID=8840 RepID=A0A493TI28_ANAPP
FEAAMSIFQRRLLSELSMCATIVNWICESHPDLGDIISSAGVCCSAMLLLNGELGCWEKHSCHTAGPRVPLPGSEGYHSFPSYGAERTFSDKASVNLPCRN